MSRQY